MGDESEISIIEDKLKIDSFLSDDQDIVNYFENAQNEGKELGEILEYIMKLGVIAAKSAQTGHQVDYVEKKFMSIQTKLEKQLDEQFGDHGDSIKDSMTEMFRKLGLDLGINRAVELEHQKGTQKGVEFEKYCEEIISEIAKHHNDRVESTGNVSGIVEGSKKGDYVYTIQDSGKKIVLEMKDYANPQSTPKLEKYLDDALENRGAEYGIVISKRKSGFSKDVGIFQEYGNKLFVALTTEDSDDAELQNDLLIIALRWARLKLKQKSGTIDSLLIVEKIENIQRIMKEFSNIKRKCTSIKGISEEISEDLEELRDTIKADLSEVSKSLK
ncbi:MAG: hypothetical protein HOE01_06445 [Thaumarchaeota archaeon]|jgi:hypothetical protein|nr:hypothetical protein [Nitrososphaerota archaeon]